MRHPILQIVLAGHFAVCLAGCTSQDSGLITYPVAGTVAYQGQPVEGATVTFHASKGGQTAMAVTDNSGNFEVRTLFNLGRDEKVGMVEGEYQVTVAKLDLKSIKSATAPPKNLLPSRYASPASSPLVAKVPSTEEKQYDFHLD